MAMGGIDNTEYAFRRFVCLFLSVCLSVDRMCLCLANQGGIKGEKGGKREGDACG